jgi:hypothetical protein
MQLLSNISVATLFMATSVLALPTPRPQTAQYGSYMNGLLGANQIVAKPVVSYDEMKGLLSSGATALVDEPRQGNEPTFIQMPTGEAITILGSNGLYTPKWPSLEGAFWLPTWALI